MPETPSPAPKTTTPKKRRPSQFVILAEEPSAPGHYKRVADATTIKAAKADLDKLADGTYEILTRRAVVTVKTATVKKVTCK